MPGSVPIETYAATVAARRTSVVASTCSAIARPAVPDLEQAAPVAGSQQLVAERDLGRVRRRPRTFTSAGTVRGGR